jgi:hypothetical protein
MKQETIFEEDYLKAHLIYFHLSKIDGLETKREILNDWFQKYKSGKLSIQNETSIGADFINDVFGDILGFNYRNPNNWNLEKELKTLVDGKKPDGAIGYFKVNEELNTGVHGIIELKDANTDLDKAQKRTNDKRTPVEQAFSYAPKYGQKCKWVIVSNFLEIRLYQANDASKYETFHLEKLQDESELKRFFFLLLKEHLLSKNGTSRLERLIQKNKEANHQKNSNESSHLLDKIYNLIKKFDGLSYVNPNILANAKPFNNTNKYVWHYSEFCLQSTEEGIFDLFKEIKVESQKIVISKQLEQEFQEWKVIEYRDKLEFVIKRLNDCFVLYIECYEDLDKVNEYINRDNVIGGSLRSGMNDYAGQLRKYPIDFREQDKVCNCLKCCYQRLDFTTVLKMLKSREGGDEHYTLESAYFHHIFGTNNFKTSFLIYKNIANREKGKNEFLYFIAKYNLLRLHNLIEGEYELEDKEEIMELIKSVDLDLIFHELDVVDPEKRRALIDIKDESIKRKAEKQIEEKIASLEKVRASFKRGSGGSFPNYTFQLNQPLAAFLLHYSSNCILGDAFTDYKTICEKVLRGYLISHSVHEDYYARLKQLETYHVNLIIFDLFPDTVEKLFKDYKVEGIVLSEKAKIDLIERTKNYLQSNHAEKYMFEPYENEHLAQALTSYHFKQVYEHIFSNLFFLLSRTKLEEKECREFIPILINFLKVDKTLYHARLKTLSKFISQNGNYFTPKELVDILKLTIEKKRLNDDDLIESICLSLNKFHPEFRMADQILLQKAILHNKEHRSNYEHLVPFWLISDESNKAILEKEFFEKLDAQFAPYFYRKLLFHEVVNIDFKDYFDKYVKWVDKSKGNGAYKLWNGEPELNSFDFINFALVIYDLDIDTNDKRVKQLTNLCDWHEWLINLENFDYSKFKSEWILIFYHEVFLKRFGQVPQIKDKVKEALEKEYHLRLAEIFVKYLN